MRVKSLTAARGLAIAAVLAASAACTDFSTTPASLGRVTVGVTDQNNAPVPQIVVDLLLPDRVTIWRSLRTSVDGTGEFGKPDGGVKSQTYVVRVTEDGQYRLADGETNDKPVTVVIGQTHDVKFRMVKRSIGGPGGT
jgi:hypothetical protein